MRARVTARAASHPVVTPVLDRLDVGPYRPGDEVAILDCIRACFDREPDLARWRHLYLDNSAGAPIIMLARDGNEVVGHLAIVPRRLRAFGRVEIAGHQIDGMTHPLWRRRGLRKILAEQARRQVVRRGWIATYGVTNEQSTHTVLTNEHRRSLGALPVMVLPLRPIAVARTLVPPPFGTGAARAAGADVVDCAAAGLPQDDGRLARVVTRGAVTWHPPRFDERHTRLFAAADGIPPIAFVRDAHYLAWRYEMGTQCSPYLQGDVGSDGNGDGELAASAVVRVAALGALRFVFLLEWHWRSAGARDGMRLMREIVAITRAVGAHGVAALAMPGTMQRSVLRHLGFIPVPAALLPRTSVVSVRLDRENEDAASWIDRTSWYLTCGDGLIL